MDWFLSFQVPVQVAIITGVIGATTIILNTWLGRRNLIISKERRFIDTISAERIKWLNEIRESFVEFSSLTTEFGIIIVPKIMKKEDDSNAFNNAFDLLMKIHASRKKIKLLLNPTELYVKQLDEAINELIVLFFKGLNDQKVDNDKLNSVNDKIEFLQQVILKAEWKRIIIEIEKGKKLNKLQVEAIFDKTAKNIGHYISGIVLKE